MGDVTPIYSLPYPLGTDRVMDGDNAMQALAEQVESTFGQPRAAATSAATVANVGGSWLPHGVGYTEDAGLPKVGDITITDAGITVNVSGLYLVTAQANFAQGATTASARRGVGYGSTTGNNAWAESQNMESVSAVTSTVIVSTGFSYIQAGTTMVAYKYLDASANSPNTIAASLRLVRLTP